MGAQLSLKAALPLAESNATVSDHCSNTWPWLNRLSVLIPALISSVSCTFNVDFFPFGVASGPGHWWWPGLVITGAKTLPINTIGGELYANYETHMFVCVKCITALFTLLSRFVILMQGKLQYLNISSVTRVNFVSFLTTDLLNNHQLILVWNHYI